MDKKAFEEKARRHEEAEIARIKALSEEVARKVEANRITQPDSQYHPFEVSFGADRLKELNDFLFTLDKFELDSRPYLNDPLLQLCQKLLGWKVEVGNDRLWHELFVRYDGGEHSENNEGSTYVIKKAWEQVKKEQDIIETARQAYKVRLNEMLEDNPNIANEDPAHWCSLCNGFGEFEALQEFGYPLSFAAIFGTYRPRHFYYGKPQ
ncbi:MAG: hypothetical protein QG673_1707 [Pseudomonadota bacterium]|nr:hypothetical protein [Pseudomonadota bacterium]